MGGTRSTHDALSFPPNATICRMAMQDITPVVGAPIPTGLRIAADMEFLSVPFKFNTFVTKDGFSLAARVTGLPVSCALVTNEKGSIELQRGVAVRNWLHGHSPYAFVPYSCTLRLAFE